MVRIEPGSTPSLAELPTTYDEAPDGDLADLKEEMAELQRKLYAQGTTSLLVVLQAMDAGGKDGTIRKVLSGLNPQGTRVKPFGAPTEEELAHDFLWRVHPHVPAAGEIVVFNRSHYEDVVAARVRGLVPEHVWRGRYEHIRAFERLLADRGTSVVKLFLHISQEEQLKRFEERQTLPEKAWKWQPGDLDDRKLWDDFAVAYEQAMAETSTGDAPWWVIPADGKKQRNVAVATVLTQALRRLDPQFPEPADAP